MGAESLLIVQGLAFPVGCEGHTVSLMLYVVGFWSLSEKIKATIMTKENIPGERVREEGREVGKASTEIRL